MADPDSNSGIAAFPSVSGAVLLGMLVAGTAAVLGIEALSALGAIAALPLRVLTALCIAAFVLTVRRRRDHAPENSTADSPALLLSALLAIATITLLVAALAAPNTWDSMTYHMARVAQWYDHGHVGHYFTSINRQLWQPPFAEYFILLGFGALGGHDYLANIPQWLGGLGAVVVTMEIARLLGAGRHARYLVGLLTATAPIVILQSTSTHTDLLGGFWVAVAAWLALAEFVAPTQAVSRALYFGAALGLALGTKGTSLPVGLPWLLVFLVASHRAGWKLLLSRLVSVTAVVLVLTGPHFLRDTATFGHALGPESAQVLLRPASLAVPSVMSNALAHASLQFGTPSSEANHALARGILALHDATGIDPSRLYPYFGGFNIVPWTTREDIAGNPIHVILALMAAILMVRRRRELSRVEWVAAAAFAGGVMAFVMSVRWGPFIARLHAPMIILLVPCLVLVLVRQWPRVAGIGSVVALVFALPALLLNQSRPLFSGVLPKHISIGARSILIAPRSTQYFASRPELLGPYRSAIGMAADRGCRRVALRAGYDSFEYPLWALGRPHDMAFQHVSRGSTPGAVGSASPCALFALDQPPAWRPAFASPADTPALARPPLTVWLTTDSTAARPVLR